ncbi:hypothetical protein Pelo_17781 [Pelomyxa schiedti]|nr:hypothetical protein Pelo_17781 [Pelomyxa schiedti]
MFGNEYGIVLDKMLLYAPIFLFHAFPSFAMSLCSTITTPDLATIPLYSWVEARNCGYLKQIPPTCICMSHLRSYQMRMDIHRKPSRRQATFMTYRLTIIPALTIHILYQSVSSRKLTIISGVALMKMSTNAPLEPQSADLFRVQKIF